ncbi:major facilitator family transporter [alpha proteobacterium U9-1i]|nr:major facilitator family transporter [alpha proteobacterium U9-1i]
MQERRYKSYLIYLLMVILAFNQLDRMALGIVLQDIKTELSASDTQLGFLTGIAFASFYAVMGLPIAHWADRGNRITILSVTVALWSIAVSATAFVGNFLQLLAVRVVTAVGEAGCMPPAHSLIADEFTRAERPRAVSIFILGGPLALLIGYFAAGWLNQFYGWRLTFVILGAPGLALALLALLTLREPRKTKNLSKSPAPVSPTSNQPNVIAVFSILWRNRAFRHLLICYSLWFLFAYGLLQWMPSFFIRSHGLSTGELGTWSSLVWGVAGGAGCILGGELATRFAAHRERQQLRGCAIAFSFFSVLSAAAFLVSDYHWAFGLLALAALGGNTSQGPMLATMQSLVPPHLRAMSIAIVYFFANLIGMGLGPLLAGVISDTLHPFFGDEALRYALVAMCPGYLWAAWHQWQASETVDRDLADSITSTSDADDAALGVSEHA